VGEVIGKAVLTTGQAHAEPLFAVRSRSAPLAAIPPSPKVLARSCY